ncbi:MAG: peroxidase family protein [Acidimicrobiia bacterium]|nr:peroxidase family protein [Acidimicrobiia bacterium]
MEALHENRRHTWRRGLGLLAVFALLLPLFSLTSATAGAQTDRLPWERLGSGAANGAVGAGFPITDSDMAFMLDQLENMDLHLASYSEAEPCAGIFGAGPNQVPTGDLTQPIGIRVLDGSCNNLVTAVNGTTPDTTRWGASDEPFEQLLTPEYKAPYGVGSAPTIGGGITDASPRHASNLINDQTMENPAAIAAGGVGIGEFGLDADDMPIPTRELLSIENVAPDGGLSAPFNDMLTFFGQFFDHGLDLTTKAGETVMMPLGCDDPLYDDGANNICDGPPPGGDDPFTNFMAISRAQDGTDPLNKTTPYVDQNQTYSSHPSHQVFLREYGTYDAVNDVLPVTGRLLNPLDGSGGPSGEEGMATWDDLQENAELNLGFLLDDRLIDDVPLMLTNPYGRFIPGPARGLPQLVIDDGINPISFVEGDLGAPVDIIAQDYVSTGHGFSIDIAHHAVPGVVGMFPPPVNCMVGDLQIPDSGAFDVTNPYDDDHDPCTYDDEMLGHHYQSGDGRVNENIALTAVHHVFHSEHNRLRNEIADKVVALPAGPDKDAWTAGGGEYLFQAAKLITEMEYQHLAFEEFARSVSPLTAVFDSYQTDINAAIVSSFANSVYRFGHSMLNDNVVRYEQDGTPADLSLVEAFLNPPAFLDVNGPVDADDGAGVAVPQRLVRKSMSLSSTHCETDSSAFPSTSRRSTSHVGVRTVFRA